jgi:hypothetical protein
VAFGRDRSTLSITARVEPIKVLLDQAVVPKEVRPAGPEKVLTNTRSLIAYDH